MGGDGSGIDADAVLVQLLALVRRQNIRREDVDAAVALLLPACSQTQDEIAWTGVRSVLMKVHISCDLSIQHVDFAVRICI